MILAHTLVNIDDTPLPYGWGVRMKPTSEGVFFLGQKEKCLTGFDQSNHFNYFQCISSSDLKRDVYSNGAIQLAIHTLDPIAEGKEDNLF